MTIDTERYLVETKEGNSVANYELVIKYPIEGERQFFVMGNKVKLTKLSELPISEVPARRRRRYTSLNEAEDGPILELLEAFSERTEPISPLLNWKAIDICSNAVRKHRVWGKPLRVPKLRKKRAS